MSVHTTDTTEGGTVSQDLPRRMQVVSVGNGQAATTPEEIERAIERTRDQLAGTIDALADRVSPKNVARRNADRARAAVSGDDGSLSAVRVGALVGGAVLLVSVVVWRRLR